MSRSAGHITRQWHQKGYRQFSPAHVSDALRRRGDHLAANAMRKSAPEVRRLAAELEVPPETVLAIFGPDIFAAAVQSLTGDRGCLYRQLAEIRRFTARPENIASIEAWQAAS